jgi:flagella basal body P-ring formation protein FlgA
MRLSVSLSALLPMVFIASAAQAQGAYTDPAAIDREVAAFTGVPAGGMGGAMLPTDRRLRLALCRSPLAMSWRTARRDSLIVECPDPGSWHLSCRCAPLRRPLQPPRPRSSCAASR